MAADDRHLALRRALLRYLRANPQACDTADGIARWWLPPALQASAQELQPLLERLCRSGHLQWFDTGDGRRFYRRPPAAAGRPPRPHRDP
ncbi:hypothetical protein [Azohydromonas caseinilytica]|uniref:Uncharacterized protein n=1 Tax=Azohydromonas caseinilytica TaxID=2728836 RepID=A0A848FEP2_9BURK|nr:hypothetical protein [Azohydromonas caseinilytica]NML16819.1 hypothetical protein [Azohydromonas caseinilytica]